MTEVVTIQSSRGDALASSDPWSRNPLVSRLRCVNCASPAPLRFDGTTGTGTWRCLSCASAFEHAGGMPVILAKDLPAEAVYDESHPARLRRLRTSSPRLFGWLKRAYLAYARAEAFVTPRTALEPAYHLRRLKTRIRGGPGRVVLDVGGGAAPYRTLLDGDADAWTVLERDPRHAKGLLEKGAKADFLIGAGEDIPLADGSCDLVVLTEVLEHCSRPGRVLAEIARILRPNGQCIGTVPQYWHVHGWPSDYFRYTHHGLELLARDAGLEVVEMRPKGGPLLLLWGVLDLTTYRWSRLPGVSLLVRVPTLWAASALDRAVFPDPRRMTYPDTAGWAFVFEKPARAGT